MGSGNMKRLKLRGFANVDEHSFRAGFCAEVHAILFCMRWVLIELLVHVSCLSPVHVGNVICDGQILISRLSGLLHRIRQSLRHARIARDGDVLPAPGPATEVSNGARQWLTHLANNLHRFQSHSRADDSHQWP